MLTKLRVLLLAAPALACLACGAAEGKLVNGSIAADWQGEGIYLIDPATSARHLIPQTESAGELAWAPDGRSLAFDLPGQVQGEDVHTIRPDGSDRRLVVRKAHDPAWAPDGERLLVVRDVCSDYYADCILGDQRVDLDTVRYDGGDLRHVAREPSGA
jgi:dipeptidyl aminopeptidase/acylaminoacyl peptidase